MTEVISVRFNSKGKFYYFDPNGITAKQGDRVIVETSKGLEYAECTYGNHMVEDDKVIPPLRPLIRVATEEDDRRAEENKRLEKRAFTLCQQKIAAYGLEMKLVDVEYSFEGTKILFFFTSDGRVDFRELVKDLASTFKARIELRQIGVRDEARMIGGLGICGKPFCCSQFLTDFHPVSIKMAKTQGLSLNPTKISGTCGRLMCCLKYEEAAYEDLVKRAPKVDAFVETPAGKGSVTGVNLLRGVAKVRLDDGPDTTLKTFSFDELSVLGGKARRQEYLAARAEGRLEEAGFTPTPPRPRLTDSPNPPATGRRPAKEPTEKKDTDTPGQEAKPGQSKSRNRRRDGRGRQQGAPQQKKQQTNAAQQQGSRPDRGAPKTAPTTPKTAPTTPKTASAAPQAKPAGEAGQSKRWRRGGRNRKKPGGNAPPGNAAPKGE